MEDHKYSTFPTQGGNHFHIFLKMRTAMDGGIIHAMDLEVRMTLLLYSIDLIQGQLSLSLPVSNFSMEPNLLHLISQM